MARDTRCRLSNGNRPSRLTCASLLLAAIIVKWEGLEPSKDP